MNIEWCEEYIDIGAQASGFVLSRVAKDKIVKVRYTGSPNDNHWFYLTSNDGKTYKLPMRSKNIENIDVRYYYEKKKEESASILGMLEKWR